jgi:ABC-2 type transport system ATP-binding protein
LNEGRLLGLGTPDEVKAMMPGALLEVRASEPRRTAALLREQLQDASVGLFGDRVHVAARNPEAATARIRQLVTSAGFEPLTIRVIEPSLEDVFVSVLATRPGPPSHARLVT